MTFENLIAAITEYVNTPDPWQKKRDALLAVEDTDVEEFLAWFDGE